MTAPADARAALVEGVQRMERSARQARPLLGGSLLVAALSLVATVVLLIHSLELTEQLEQSETRAQLSERRTRELAVQLKAATLVATSARSTPFQREAALEQVREVSQQLPAGTTGVTIPAPNPVAATQVLTFGSAGGWDVDVFWCNGAGAAGNYLTARNAAISLANTAAAARAIAPGTQLGRIRLLPVTPADGSIWRAAMNGRDLLVVWDPGPGEEAAAQAVLANLPAPQAAATVNQATLPHSQALSRWYLSVFACAAQ